MELCKICKVETKFIFIGRILKKYDIKYYKCPNCGFIQTEPAFWLKEAYSEPIGLIDVGMIQRNEFICPIVKNTIDEYLNKKSKFLDYGGGYGLFVRMMRDRGYDFKWYDSYCTNLFAKFFEIEDLENETKFELVTAIEVFEHLEHPLSQIEEIAKYSDTILFTTQLQPSGTINNQQDWNYFEGDYGQHVSFYTKDSLNKIGVKLGLKLYSDGQNIHLFSNKIDRFNFKHRRISSRLIKKLCNYLTLNNKQSSLTMNDYNIIRNKNNNT